jgi:hypothetical protein
VPQAPPVPRQSPSLIRGAKSVRYENQLEAQDLGNDVSFVVLSLDARPAGSAGRVQERWGFTVTWAAGMIVRVIGSTDIDEGRAAAERLAEERG